jgi:hypothetical protein
MAHTYVLRVWLDDRPGALGQVASRVGAVGGDVVGIEILERGGGQAVDELVVELPAGDLGDLLIAELAQVDGVGVEALTPVTDAIRDPRLDALETAALLVGARTRPQALEELCVHAARTLGAAWAAVVDLDAPEIVSRQGEAPPLAWLVAFVRGSQSAARVSGGSAAASDVVWAPLPGAGMALVLGRDGQPYRARERHQAAALARIVDTRYRELTQLEARMLHPARG